MQFNHRFKLAQLQAAVWRGNPVSPSVSVTTYAINQRKELPGASLRLLLKAY